MRMWRTLVIIFALFTAANGQTEVLTNESVIQLSTAGLGKQLIITKINSTVGRYDISANALIELKKAGVEDEIIAVMIEKSKAVPVEAGSGTDAAPRLPNPQGPTPSPVSPPLSAKHALLSAKTISFEKASLAPSRQALEKELLKRADWKKLDLTIVRYRNQADLYVEIGFVHGSILTHRYVFRVYDRRSGAVLAAGETTSWSSLAENLARHISKRLNAVAAG